jgi:peptide deformylase
MAVRPIVVWPDPRLRQPTKQVTAITDEVRALYRDLCDSMFAENGLGIAAVQIGDATKMFIVEPVLAGKTAEDPPVAFINPEIVWTSDETQKSDEGCLSFPGIFIQVDRPMRAKVRALGINGEMFEVEAEGLFARCVLHENDHLTGKLLVDFVGPLKRQMIKRKLAKREGASADADADAS